jgi:CheY-like chemotaxis protein
MGQIMVVAPSGRGFFRKRLFERAGHDVVLAETAPQAVELLATSSLDLLVSEIRLGRFNGLYLMIRGQETQPGMATILIDESDDPVLAREAMRGGAVYLAEPLEEDTLLQEVSRLLAKTPERRWARTQLASELAAEVQRQSVRVLDLSYGGLRLEIPTVDELPAQFPVVFPDYGLAIRARAVWTYPAAPGSVWCGAEWFDTDDTTEAEWRHLVDAVRGNRPGRLQDHVVQSSSGSQVRFDASPSSSILHPSDV